MRQTITHSPISKTSIFEQSFLRGQAIDHAPAPMPNCGPFQNDTEADFFAALDAAAREPVPVQVERLEPPASDCLEEQWGLPLPSAKSVWNAILLTGAVVLVAKLLLWQEVGQ